MLTDLTFLDEGRKWPPVEESARLRRYEENKKLFEGYHHDVYESALKRIERVIGNFNEIVSFTTVLNFQKLMSLKIADLLFGEPPIIQSDDQESVDWIKERSDLVNTSFMTAIDVSRYGDGVLYVREEDGNGIIDITQPNMWFQVVSPDNVKKVQYHVLAWQEKNKLIVQIHDKGSIDSRIYNLSDQSFIKNLESSEIINTGLNDFAVIPVHNIITSDRCYGIDDYGDIDSIVSEIMVRVGQINKILDKHAAPSMQGPASALERDPVSGEWRLKMGTYIPLESGDNKAEYLTWEGELTANFTMIEKLVNFLYTISEMGSAIFGDTNTRSGQIASGSALRRLMVSPLAKVNRIRMRFDPALKKAIDLASQIGGKGVKSLTDKEISITWQDGLPGDPKEESEIIKDRIESGTMSVRRALMQYDGMSEEDADNELEAIMTEDRMNNPVSVLTSIDGDTGDE